MKGFESNVSWFCAAVVALVALRFLLFWLGRSRTPQPFCGPPVDRNGLLWILTVIVATVVAIYGISAGHATETLCALIAAHSLTAIVLAQFGLTLISGEQRASGLSFRAVQTMKANNFSIANLDNSAFTRILHELKCLGNRRASADTRALVQAQLVEMRGRIDVMISEALAVQSLGLLGTFAGLVLMFTKLGEALGNPDGAAAATDIQIAMASLGAAFWTTIASTFFANLILAKLASKGSQALDRLEADLVAQLEKCWFDGEGFHE